MGEREICKSCRRRVEFKNEEGEPYCITGTYDGMLMLHPLADDCDMVPADVCRWEKRKNSKTPKPQ